MKKKKNLPQESIVPSENNFQKERIVETSIVSNDNKDNFEQQLVDFFNKNKPAKVKKARKIAETFFGREQEVMDHLHNKYVVHKAVPVQHKKGSNKIHHEMATGIEESSSEKVTFTNEAKPKKSRKMLVIAVVLILVAGLGAFIMMKGKHSKNEVKQEVKATTGNEENHKKVE